MSWLDYNEGEAEHYKEGRPTECIADAALVPTGKRHDADAAIGPTAAMYMTAGRPCAASNLGAAPAMIYTGLPLGCSAVVRVKLFAPTDYPPKVRRQSVYAGSERFASAGPRFGAFGLQRRKRNQSGRVEWY